MKINSRVKYSGQICLCKRHDVGNTLEFTCHTCDIPTLDNLDFLVGAPLRALKIVNSSLSKIKDDIFRQGTNGAKFNITLVSTEERKSPSFNLYPELIPSIINTHCSGVL